MYRSLIAQTMHYFARPHRAPRRTPIGGAAAWRGETITPAEYVVELAPNDIAEIERALERVGSRSMHDLGREDFPLPELSRSIDAWRREVSDGRGFVVVRGVPVERWGQAASETFFYCFGLHLGAPGAQNPQGDLLGHVRDTGASAKEVRAYRTASNIEFHCDAADLVGLLCLRAAKSGGLSRIASSIAIYDELALRRPDLVDRLYEPFLLDTHGEGGVDWVPVHACRFDGERLRTFWHSDYFRSSHEYAGAPPLGRIEREVLDVYDEIASSPRVYVDMELLPGDIQLLSNHTVVHARTAYEDHAEPERKRHLLRLWVSLEPPGDRIGRLKSALSMIGGVARGRVRRAIRGRATRISSRPGT